MDEHLFHGRGRLADALEQQGAKMKQVVANEPEDSVRQADVDDWSTALAHHFAVACPTLMPH